MSRTVYICWRDDGFWAYDVHVGVLLKYLIDQAELYSTRAEAVWLRESIDHWRVNAIVSDYGVYLDKGWSTEQVQTVLELLDETCKSLAQRASISAVEMNKWDMIDGRGIDSRGHEQVSTALVVALGQAVKALVAGSLPAAPSGSWWFYGPDGRTEIAKKS